MTPAPSQEKATRLPTARNPRRKREPTTKGPSPYRCPEPTGKLTGPTRGNASLPERPHNSLSLSDALQSRRDTGSPASSSTAWCQWRRNAALETV